MNKKVEKKNSSGFSLTEVMVAISILALSILTLSQTWSGNYNRLRKIKIYNDMAYLLEMKMKEFEAKYEKMPFDKVPKKLEGQFKEKYSKYSWIFLVQEFEIPDLEEVFLGQEKGVSEVEKMIFSTVKDFLVQRIREVQLTVSIKVNKKELKHSVATYFIKK